MWKESIFLLVKKNYSTGLCKDSIVVELSVNPNVLTYMQKPISSLRYPSILLFHIIPSIIKMTFFGPIVLHYNCVIIFLPLSYQILAAQTARLSPLHLRANAHLRWYPQPQLPWPPCLPSPPLGSTAPSVALVPHFPLLALHWAHPAYLAHHQWVTAQLAAHR